MARSSGWWVVFFLASGFMLGFCVAMILVGDSPWEEFWLRMARCCADG